MPEWNGSIEEEQEMLDAQGWNQLEEYELMNNLKSGVNGISEADMVNSPVHYVAGGIEAIDVLKAKLTPEEYRGYLKGSILKYMLRANFKGKHDQDIHKADWFMGELSDATPET